MAFMRFAVPALAVASSAYAQCSTSGTSTLQAAADAPTGCATYSGSIAVSTSVSGDLVLDGITKLTGSLLIPSAANLTTISGSTLQSIGGTFSIMGATILSSLSFPELASVDTLSWITLGPTLQGISTALTTVSSLNIRNTYLQSLSGITLKTADTIYIAQNGYLTSIDMPLTSVTTQLTLQSNGNGATVASFPNLVSAGGIDIRNVSSLTLSALGNVTSAFSVTGNTLTSLSLPNLTSSNGFAVDNNPSMTALSLPAYTATSGAFSIQNNTALTGAISVPLLATVKGAAYVIGTFNNLTMPKLNSVLGAMEIISTQVIADTCSHFDSISGPNAIIQGAETCSPSASAAVTSSSGSSTSSTSSSSASSSKSAGQYTATPASVFTVFGALAALFEAFEMLL